VTKKIKAKPDVDTMMTQIQEQLAVMNEKLDSFMTKSLTELAQALANSKPAPRPIPQSPAPLRPQQEFPPRRQMYAVVCFECGKDTEIPFKPSGNRPVFCKECFALRKGRPAPVTPAQPLSSAPAQASAPATPTERSKKAGKPAKAPKKAAKKPAAKKKAKKK